MGARDWVRAAIGSYNRDGICFKTFGIVCLFVLYFNAGRLKAATARGVSRRARLDILTSDSKDRPPRATP